MATKTWIGGTDAVFLTAGNWSGGVAPITGDDVILATTNTTFPNINGAVTGINLNSMTVTPRFTGNIGSVGSPLDIDISNGGTTKLTYAGSGEFCSIAGDVPNLEAQHKNGTLIAVSGTWGTAGVQNIPGPMQVLAAAVMAGAWNVSSTGILHVEANGTACPLCYSEGMVTFDGRDVTASRQMGGKWFQKSDGQLILHFLVNGITYLWNTGANTAIENVAGLLTVENNPQGVAPTIGTYKYWPRAREVLTYNHINIVPSTSTPIGARSSGAASSALV